MSSNLSRIDCGSTPLPDDRKRVIRLIDTILDRNAFGPAKQALEALLGQLRSRMIEHFRCLESSLREARTPGSEAYVVIHARLLHDFDEHQRQFAAGSGRLSDKFVEFLGTWLRLHIQHASRCDALMATGSPSGATRALL